LLNLQQFRHLQSGAASVSIQPLELFFQDNLKTMNDKISMFLSYFYKKKKVNAQI
jgi:hypothetical protein